jgi:hypothetical protein
MQAVRCGKVKSPLPIKGLSSCLDRVRILGFSRKYV